MWGTGLPASLIACVIMASITATRSRPMYSLGCAADAGVCGSNASRMPRACRSPLRSTLMQQRRDDVAGLVAEVDRRAAQLAPVAGEPPVAEGVVVTLPVLHDIQPQARRGSADLAAGHVPVLDGHDRVAEVDVGAVQVVQHDLARGTPRGGDGPHHRAERAQHLGGVLERLVRHRRRHPLNKKSTT
jgi:hypothetical protein